MGTSCWPGDAHLRLQLFPLADLCSWQDVINIKNQKLSLPSLVADVVAMVVGTFLDFLLEAMARFFIDLPLEAMNSSFIDLLLEAMARSFLDSQNDHERKRFHVVLNDTSSVILPLCTS